MTSVVDTLQGIVSKQLQHILRDDLKVQTLLQTLFALRFSDPAASAVYETILAFGLSAEQQVPGSFYTYIETLLQRFNHPLDGELQNVFEHHPRAARSLETRPAMASDLIACIDTVPPGLNQDMLRHALDLVGFGGKIVVEKTESTPSVELTNGFTYSLKPRFPVKLVGLVEPRILCIDGYVETVGEIHRLLETSSMDRASVIVFLRGLSDDVLNTLRVNYDRGSLRVIPVVVPFDLEGINTLVDIATACGTDVVSSNKGQLISNLSLDDAVTIPKASVFPDRIVLINPASVASTKRLVRQLRSRRSETSEEDVHKLLDMRIRALSPNQVVIRLFDDEKYVLNSYWIDLALRRMRSMITHGIPTEDDLAFVVGQSESAKCVRYLRNLGAIIRP